MEIGATDVICSIASDGVRCGSAYFYSPTVVLIAAIFVVILGLVALLFVWDYQDRQFKKKLRDLGYGYVLAEMEGAKEVYIKPSRKKEGREVP